jgi:hypothetical protein
MDDLQTLLEFFLVGICLNGAIHDERGQGSHIHLLTPFIERSVKTRIHSSQYINRFHLDELLDYLDRMFSSVLAIAVYITEEC